MFVIAAREMNRSVFERMAELLPLLVSGSAWRYVGTRGTFVRVPGDNGINQGSSWQ